MKIVDKRRLKRAEGYGRRTLLVVSEKQLTDVVGELRLIWELRRAGHRPTLPLDVAVVCCSSPSSSALVEWENQLAVWVAPLASVAVVLIVERIAIGGSPKRRVAGV